MFLGAFLVETTGLEPVTSCVWSKRSNQLSYASVSVLAYYSTFICRCPQYYEKIYNSLTKSIPMRAKIKIQEFSRRGLSDDFTKTSAVHVRKIRRRSAWRRDFGCCDFVPNDLYPHAILAAVPCCGAALRNWYFSGAVPQYSQAPGGKPQVYEFHLENKEFLGQYKMPFWRSEKL